MLVKELLSFGGLVDAKVVAGSIGLTREVSSISVLEVAERQIKSWVLPDQIYITSFYAIMNDRNAQLEVIKALFEANSAGLVICHIEMFVQEIDLRIIEYCDSIGFPIIVAPSQTSYIEILNPILLKLVEEQTDQEEVTHERILGLIASHSDPLTVYNLMSSSYGRFLVFLDINDTVLFPRHNKIVTEKKDKLLQKLTRLKRNSLDKPYVFESQGDRFAHIILQHQGLRYGSILASVSRHNEISDINQLKRYAMICILVATKSARANELEIARKQEYINDLITWNFRSREVALTGAESFGWDLMNKHTLLIINLNDYYFFLQNQTQDYEKLISEVLYSKIRSIMKSQNINNILGKRSDMFICLLETTNKNELNQLSMDVIEACAQTISGSVSIGFSEPFEDIIEIPQAYQQAYKACMIGRHLHGINRVSSFRDLGIYPHLQNSENYSIIANIRDEMFEGILDYDKVNNSELFETLSALIWNDMDVDKTADGLFVHRNTVLYRKNRIIEILKFNPFKMPYLLNTILVVWSVKSSDLYVSTKKA